MMLRTIAIDDEPPALTVISAFCNKVDFVQLEKTFTNTDEAKRHLTTNEVDLIFPPLQVFLAAVPLQGVITCN